MSADFMLASAVAMLYSYAPDSLRRSRPIDNRSTRRVRDFRFWIFDFGMRTQGKVQRRFLNPKSKIENPKSLLNDFRPDPLVRINLQQQAVPLAAVDNVDFANSLAE